VHRIGTARNNQWDVTQRHVDTAVSPPRPRLVRLPAVRQSVTFDLQRTVMIVIDMVNDFCAPGGNCDRNGIDVRPNRKPVRPLNRLLPRLRRAHVPVLWLNWGMRPDLLEAWPNQLHTFDPFVKGTGIGAVLPGHPGRVLVKGSWDAAIFDQLDVSPNDIFVDKHQISGFWGTPLNSILGNMRMRTLLFAGVNLDQCVNCTLQDAFFLGYHCILLEDCCATTSPHFCVEATLWNVKHCFGFVSSSTKLLKALDTDNRAASGKAANANRRSMTPTARTRSFVTAPKVR
jgi:nicotinamidase-related amidase